MLLAAMLAMVLAAAAPAFAQATAVQYGDDDGDGVDDSTFCNQVQNVLATQGQYGDANAAATDDSEAVAEAANQLDVSQNQVLNCFVGDNFGENTQGGGIDDSIGVVEVDDDGDGVVDEEQETIGVVEVDDDGDGAVDEELEVVASDASSASAAAATTSELPETGGASLLALGAGALLVAGGLLARRIVR